MTFLNVAGSNTALNKSSNPTFLYAVSLRYTLYKKGRLTQTLGQLKNTMIIYGIIALTLIVLGALYFAKRTRNTVPVFVNGLIPSLPGASEKAEHGTTVYIFYSDTERDEPEREIFRGYANEDGAVIASISSKEIGRPVTIRTRHAGFKFKDHNLIVPKHGIIYTAEMTRDGIYEGGVRGAPINDLKSHFEEANVSADDIRSDAIRLAQSMSTSLSLIPLLYWPIAYVVVIFAFALDYYNNSVAFDISPESLTSFESFAHALYFSIVTITTLGYGDIYPIEDTFRLWCAFQAIIGVIIIGLFLNSLFHERKK